MVGGLEGNPEGVKVSWGEGDDKVTGGERVARRTCRIAKNTIPGAPSGAEHQSLL